MLVGRKPGVGFDGCAQLLLVSGCHLESGCAIGDICQVLSPSDSNGFQPLCLANRVGDSKSSMLHPEVVSAVLAC